MERLWQVTYTVPNTLIKCKATFIQWVKGDGSKEYWIANDFSGVQKNVTKQFGNDFFKELMRIHPDAKLHKIIDTQNENVLTTS